jgi:TonB family protein
MRPFAVALACLLSSPVAAGEIDDLVAELARPEAPRREQAIKALSALGPQRLREVVESAVPLVMRLTQSAVTEGRSSDPLVEQVMDGLGRAGAGYGVQASEKLAESALADMAGFENDVAVRALILLGPAAKAAIPVLERGLHSGAYAPPRQAVKALAAVDQPGWPTLVAALASPRADVRALATEQLQLLTVAAPDAPSRAAAERAWRGPLGATAGPRAVRPSLPGPVALAPRAAVAPAIARPARVYGTVVVDCLIDERGRVIATHVLKSIPLLDAAALDAVKQYRYEPFQDGGHIAPVLWTVAVDFPQP